MNRIPLAPIEFLGVGDVVSGQDGNKYIVCEKVSILYWEPYTNATVTTVVTPVAPSKPTPTTPSKTIKKVKEVKEKYYWKDNEKKPKYEWNDYNKWTEMEKSLKPKVSPNKFPAGYVWTTKFRNISYVVDTGYKGYSTTMSRFWRVVHGCPPCLDANDYPFEYKSDGYYVDYDEQGNKFWSDIYGYGMSSPLQQAYKFVEGTTRTVGDGDTRVSRRDGDGSAWWDIIQDDSDDE